MMFKVKKNMAEIKMYTFFTIIVGKKIVVIQRTLREQNHFINLKLNMPRVGDDYINNINQRRMY